MKIVRTATAGTLESSDCMVTVIPADLPGVELEIDSVVLAQYGEAIRSVASGTAARLGAAGARVRIQDRGAYDCVIAARVEAALIRASKEEAS